MLLPIQPPQTLPKRCADSCSSSSFRSFILTRLPILFLVTSHLFLNVRLRVDWTLHSASSYTLRFRLLLCLPFPLLLLFLFCFPSFSSYYYSPSPSLPPLPLCSISFSSSSSFPPIFTFSSSTFSFSSFLPYACRWLLQLLLLQLQRYSSPTSCSEGFFPSLIYQT